MLRSVALVTTDDSEDGIASIIRVTRIGEPVVACGNETYKLHFTDF
jgi:hypothetical protein